MNTKKMPKALERLLDVVRETHEFDEQTGRFGSPHFDGSTGTSDEEKQKLQFNYLLAKRIENLRIDRDSDGLVRSDEDVIQEMRRYIAKMDDAHPETAPHRAVSDEMILWAYHRKPFDLTPPPAPQ